MVRAEGCEAACSRESMVLGLSTRWRLLTTGFINLIQNFLNKLQDPENWYKLASSRGLSIFLMVFIVFLIAVWVVPFQIYGVPSQVSFNIANSWVMRLFYFLLVLNGVLCCVRTFSRLKTRVPKVDETIDEDSIKSTKGYSELAVNEASGVLLDRLSRKFKRRGFKVSRTDQSIFALRSKFSVVGSFLFHLSFALLVFGVITSHYLRFEGNLLVTEGQEFFGKDSEYLGFNFSSNLYRSLPDINFKVDRVQPEFWEGRLLFTDLKSEIGSIDGQTWSDVVRLSSPKAFGSSQLQLKGFGYSPLFLVKGNKGEELDSAYVRLGIFPPGREDNFKFLRSKYQAFVKLYPDHFFQRKKIGTKTMNYRKPLYVVRIKKGSKTIFSGYLKPGQEAKFNGLSFSFPEMRNFAEFRVVRDLGFPVIVIGLILGAIGIAQKLLLPKTEVRIFLKELKGESVLVASIKSDYCKELMRARFERFLRSLG